MACPRLGLIHSTLNVRQPFDHLLTRLLDVRPHLLWTHMLLTPPPGAPAVSELLALCELARRRFGTIILLHDGDYKEKVRHPEDLSQAVDLALCNHRHDRSVWKIPTLYWPYACFPQDRIREPCPEWACRLAFAGQMGSGIYDARTRLLQALALDTAVGLRVFSSGNTLLATPELAASSEAVLGFGRPGSDWIDTRVFQYPGAGAVLLHNDVPSDSGLEPNIHFLPYTSESPESVAAVLAEHRRQREAVRLQMRLRAFDHGQVHHSYTARVTSVLDALDLDPAR